MYFVDTSGKMITLKYYIVERDHTYIVHLIHHILTKTLHTYKNVLININHIICTVNKWKKYKYILRYYSGKYEVLFNLKNFIMTRKYNKHVFKTK